jgi:hypothetical protein
MEELVIALIATGNMSGQQKVSVPEPAKFEAFDLQALRLPDQHKHDSQGRPFDGKRSYVLQIAP